MTAARRGSAALPFDLGDRPARPALGRRIAEFIAAAERALLPPLNLDDRAPILGSVVASTLESEPMTLHERQAATAVGDGRDAPREFGREMAQDMANAIRALAMDAVEKAKSGHPGMPMGMADVATVLFTQLPEIRRRRSRTGPTATASCSRPATARCCCTRLAAI